MAKRFGAYLIEQRLLTEAQLAQALERQVTVGGRLGTNLVELDFLTDQQLAQALGRHLQMEAAPSTALDDIPADVIQQFSKELAQRHGAIPFRKEGRTLCIAMADPSELPALDDIKFIVGCAVKTFLAPEMKIQYALEKYYGVARPLRYVSMWIPPANRMLDGDGAEGEYILEQTFPSIENFMQGLKSASEELLHAKHRDEIVAILLRECARVADQALFFAIAEGRAIGLRGRGGRYLPDRFLGLELRLEESPLLRQVVEKAEPVMQRVTPEAVGTALSALLVDESRPRQFAAFPLVAGGHAGSHDGAAGFTSRVVGVLYVETRPDDFPYVEPLRKLVVKAGMAMDVLIMRKKILEL
jgi:hypothetical protein